MAISVRRVEQRKTNQRREDRYRDVVANAAIILRRRKVVVRVVNLSESGMMIETDARPTIGDRVGVDFEGFDRVSGFVRWVKGGRVGIDFCTAAISLTHD